ncbi:transporter associated domain-containing protein [Buchnera aphidicola (Ceratoglyphina bambusae)]|uniref:transporter associated domain-containing protein n=1 Tax=Buchnera aphidicola TaxID=9 RepID=UPI0031B89BA6
MNYEKKKNIYKKSFLNIFKKQLFKNRTKHKNKLISLIKYSEQNKLIDNYTKNILKRIIKIAKKRVKEIMIPKLNMITLKYNYNLHKCLEVAIKTSYSKFPIKDKNNYIKGFITIKDLIPFIRDPNKTFCIKKILKPLKIIPESKYIDKILYEFKLKKFCMAIIIDEFGTISGLITAKDVIEYIICKKEKKFNKFNKFNIKKIDKKKFLVKGLTKLEEFNEYFKTTFKDSEIDTIGGLILKYFGEMPNIKKKIKIKNYCFKIIKTNKIRIIEMKIKKIKN